MKEIMKNYLQAFDRNILARTASLADILKLKDKKVERNLKHIMSGGSELR